MRGGYNYMYSSPQGPEVYTPKEKVESLLTQLIGSVIPGAGTLVPMAMPYIWKLTGLQNDLTLDAPIITEATPYGAAMYDKFQKSFASGGYAIDQLDDATKFKVSKTLAKLFNSEKAFKQMQAEGQYANMAYEEFLHMKAAEYSNNALTDMVYGYIDPLDTKTTNKYLSMAGSNLARRQFVHGGIDSYTRRNAFANAAKVMTGIFTNEKGEYDYEAHEYGGFRAQEAAAIAAALSRDTDFLGSADITDPKSIEDATKKFRRNIQDYAKALAPLKDVFGKDIDNLLKTIEELAGVGITAMGSEKAGRVARDIANKISLGRYGMEQVSATANLMSQELASMDTPTMNRLQGVNYATAALDMAKGGFVSNAFTARDMAGFAAQRVLDTGTSRGAEAFDLGYSLWKKRAIDTINTARAKDIDINEWKARTGLKGANAIVDATGNITTTARAKMIATLDSDRYMKLIQQRTARGMTAMAANYDLAGVTNQHQLQAGYNYGYYREAKENNLGLYSSLEDRHRMEQDIAGLRVVHDNTIGGTEGQRAVVYSKLMETTLKGDNMKLLNMSDTERITKLTEELGYSADEAEIANAIMSRMSYQGEYSELYKSKVNMENLAMQREATKKAEQRREAIDAFMAGKKGTRYGNFKEFVVDTFDAWLNDDNAKNADGTKATNKTFVGAVSEDLKTKVAALAQDPAEQAEYKAVFAMAETAAKAQIGDIDTAFDLKATKDSLYTETNGAITATNLANTSYSASSDAAIKWAKNNNAKNVDKDSKGNITKLTGDSYKAYLDYEAEKIVRQNKEAYVDNIKSTVRYAMSAEGLANPYAREAIIGYMRLDGVTDLAKMKDDDDVPYKGRVFDFVSAKTGVHETELRGFVDSAPEAKKKAQYDMTTDAGVLRAARDFQAAKLAVATEVDVKTLDKYMRDQYAPEDDLTVRTEKKAKAMEKLAAIYSHGSQAIGGLSGVEGVLRTIHFDATSRLLSKTDSHLSNEQKELRGKSAKLWEAFNKQYKGSGEDWLVAWNNWIANNHGFRDKQEGETDAQYNAAKLAFINKTSDIVKQAASVSSTGVYANQGGPSDILGALTSFFTSGTGAVIIEDLKKGAETIVKGGEAIAKAAGVTVNDGVWRTAK